MLGKLFGSRSYAYEIYVQVDGRWRLDKRLESEPGATQHSNEQLEKNAIAQANALLNMGDFTAVKVMRGRSRDDGFTTQSEIFSKQAPPNRTKAMQVRPFKAQFPICESFHDFSKRESTRAFGTVFREFLDKQNATALELLHAPQVQRKLLDNSNFLRAGIYALAGAQTQAGLPGQAERSRKLEAHFDKLNSFTREKLAEKNLPSLETGSFATLVERMYGRYKDPDARFLVFFQTAKSTVQMQSYAGKLDFALKGFEGAPSEVVAGMLDELAASCLDSSTLIQDLLGPRSSLSDALIALAELANGSLAPPPGPQPDPILMSLTRLLGEKRLPLCSDTLWERIIGNLSSKALLAKNEPKKEWQLTRTLNHKLLSMAPENLKEQVDHVGRMRMERVRNMEQ